jgi:hypothetical protein
MSDNQKNCLYVITVIIVPFIFVHVSNTAGSRLIAIIWVFIMIPCLFLFFAFNPKAKILADTSRLNKNANPNSLNRWTIALRFISFLAAIAWFLYFTMPVLVGTYSVYVLKEPLTHVKDSVASQSSPVLATGIYWDIKLSQDPTVGYMYLFPTKYRFGDSQYEFIILPNTNIILDVES